MTPPKTIVLLLHPDGGSWRFDGPTALEDARKMTAVERRGTEQNIAVYDWALRAYRGGDVPTVEQWDELVAAARKIVNDPHWLPLLRKASAALTPQPPPLPEIAECPRCGHECSVADLGATVAVVCKACNWEGPAKTEELAAINGHNYEAAKLRPEEEPKPQRKVCDTCRHGKKPASHPSCQTCFKAAAGERPAWEPKP